MKKIRSFALSYRRALKGAGRAVFFAISTSALSGLMEAMGLLTLLPLLNTSGKDLLSLIFVLSLLALFLCLASVLKYLSEKLSTSIFTKIEARNRRTLTRTLMTSSWASVGRLSQGQITSAVMSESTQVANGVSALLSATASLVIVFILGAVAVSTSPSLMAMTLLFAGISITLFSLRIRRVKQVERDISEMSALTGEDVSSVLGEIKYLRESGTSRVWIDKIARDSRKLALLRQRQLLIPNGTRLMVDTTGAIFLCVVVGLAMIIEGKIGSGLVFIALFYRLIPRLQMFQAQLGTAIAQETWIELWFSRLDDLMSTVQESPPEIQELQIETKHRHANNIKFESVSFTFEGRLQTLRNLSWEIKAGSKVALMGPSGAGKTTLIDLLLGLIEPQAGEILIDGKSITAPEDVRALRLRAGVVPQDVPFRRGTIEENIAWGFPVDQSRLLEVIGVAQLTDFVSGLPNGTKQFFDSKSVGLSGGQRQRIGLARALYRRPSLLILDEGTSALDNKTESAFFDALSSLSWETTTILITHRKSLAYKLDGQFQLKNGNIERVL